MSLPGFTGGALDRADRLRHDSDALAAARRDPDACLLDLGEGYQPRVTQDGRLAWTAMPDDDVPLVLLGLDAASRGSRSSAKARAPGPPSARRR